MKAFENKNTAERYTYAAGFTRYLASGITIATPDATVDVHDDSEVADPSPTDMIDVPAALSADPIVIDGMLVPAGQAVVVALKGGVQGCDYVVTFKPTLSNGDKPIFQAKLSIARYVPTP